MSDPESQQPQISHRHYTFLELGSEPRGEPEMDENPSWQWMGWDLYGITFLSAPVVTLRTTAQVCPAVQAGKEFQCNDRVRISSVQKIEMSAWIPCWQRNFIWLDKLSAGIDRTCTVTYLNAFFNATLCKKCVSLE